jgi:hypothetical protein
MVVARLAAAPIPPTVWRTEARFQKAKSRHELLNRTLAAGGRLRYTHFSMFKTYANSFASFSYRYWSFPPIR